MASENEAVVRRNIDEAWNGGRFEVLDETVAEHYVRHESALPRTVHGRAELKETIRRYRDAFPDLNLVIEDMVSSGDLVTTRWSASGTHRGDLMGLGATNKRSVVTGLNLSRFLDGKVTEEWSEWNEAAMLRQLGVLPERESTQEKALLGVSNLRTRVGEMLGGR
jgi:steroid delta-isomerase-like uncharacterized protein